MVVWRRGTTTKFRTESASTHSISPQSLSTNTQRHKKDSSSIIACQFGLKRRRKEERNQFFFVPRTRASMLKQDLSFEPCVGNLLQFVMFCHFSFLCLSSQTNRREILWKENENWGSSRNCSRNCLRSEFLNKLEILGMQFEKL